MREITYKVFHRGYNIVKYVDDIFLVVINCPPYENESRSKEIVSEEKLDRLYAEYLDWWHNRRNLEVVGFCLSDRKIFPQNIELQYVTDGDYLDVKSNGWTFFADFQDYIVKCFELDSKLCYEYVRLLEEVSTE